MRRLWNMTSRRIGSSLVVAVLTLCGLAAPAAATDQVPFNAEGTAVITAVAAPAWRADRDDRQHFGQRDASGRFSKWRARPFSSNIQHSMEGTQTPP